jgi:hypothetical protein
MAFMKNKNRRRMDAFDGTEEYSDGKTAPCGRTSKSPHGGGRQAEDQHDLHGLRTECGAPISTN